ncbi:unnamed protein product [Allacma fusca]|uniref:Uncharacterized protein n=1 Tax=Allacma fusca TaxID=39272 RepID=A0A8J2JPY1_9HEXA|nr:unnamed protein product [Allacma fusca]
MSMELGLSLECLFSPVQGITCSSSRSTLRRLTPEHDLSPISQGQPGSRAFAFQNPELSTRSMVHHSALSSLIPISLNVNSHSIPFPYIYNLTALAAEELRGKLINETHPARRTMLVLLLQ